MQTNDSEGMGIPIGIGEGSHIRRAIVDKNARIGKNVMVLQYKYTLKRINISTTI